MDQGRHLPQKTKDDGQSLLLTNVERRPFVTKRSRQKKSLPEGKSAVCSPASHTACECKRCRGYLLLSDIAFSELSPEGLQVSSTWPLRFRFFSRHFPLNTKKIWPNFGFSHIGAERNRAHAVSFHSSTLPDAWPGLAKRACPLKQRES